MQNCGSNPRECEAGEAGEFAAVILAAGRSSRMGKPKLLLPWGTTTILGHLIEQWRAMGAKQIAIVCAARDEAVAQALDCLGLSRRDRIFNQEPEKGMFSSIQCAARWDGWQPAIENWVVALGDQPQLHDETLRGLLAWAKKHPREICLPAYNGHGRHPVLMPKGIFLELATTKSPTLKEFLQAHKTSMCQLADAGLAMDIDTPAAYEEALRRNFPKS